MRSISSSTLQRADGALEHRGVGDVEGETGILEQLAGLLRLGAALVGEVDVGPAGEAVFLVPGRLAMAQQYDFLHDFREIGTLQKMVGRRLANTKVFYNISRCNWTPTPAKWTTSSPI
jgi:hypothetical protein